MLPVGWIRKLMLCGALFAFALANRAVIPPIYAQDNAAQSAAATSQPANLSADQLQKLVSKIALYPDDLLAISLPASTQPVQIVQAHRFLEQRKSNPKAEPPKSWDPSVVALLNYPEVIALMNSDLTWTEELGNAVINQQEDVMDAIQNFRQKVYAAGNLKSNDKQKVEVQQGPPLTETPQGGEVAAPGPNHQTIVIQSASPDNVYVPSYDPATVAEPVMGGAPYPYSYSAPYPYYWAPGAAFFTGAVFGAAVGYGLSWANGGIYSGDVNINNNFNSNRISNGNLSGNRENRWRADRGQRGNRGRQGNRPTQQSVKSGLAQRAGGQAGRNRGQAGLSQRAGGGRASQRPSAGARGPGATGGRGPGGGAGLGQSAGGGRGTPRAAQRPAAAGGRGGAGGLGGGAGRANLGAYRGGGAGAANLGGYRGGAGGANFGGYRGGGAFSGAGNGFAANRSSFRGNQSMGRSQFGGNRSYGGARGGGGGFRGGGGGGRGGGRGGGGGRRR
jgi:Protein of unknown function (DUF3300)